ncbi:MAG: 3-deoxy-7-phosphoheptulonate synthase [Bacillota bacterium]|nr:3-deoxy-7-phosphoheptulonate synthase [Bacillota bacterium]
MILVLKSGTSPEALEELCVWLRHFGVQTNPIIGSEMSVVGLVGDTSAIDIDQVRQHELVERVMKVQEPYKRANRRFHPDDTIVEVDGVAIGGPDIVLIAGPCSVESEEQIAGIARQVQSSGAKLLRGGAFKPRSSPYAFQGLKAEGLLYLSHAREQTGLPLVSEITNVSQIEMFESYVDIFQVGTRNMQNFELLKQLGQTRKPVLLKRGFMNTLDELLMSAEYIMSGGNDKVILCERGIRTFETATRNTLDVSAIPVLKRRSHLPVIVDPSHAAGDAWLVSSLSKAAIAAGADGLIIEVHNDPSRALSDGQQSLTPAAFDALVPELRRVAEAVGRRI